MRVVALSQPRDGVVRALVQIEPTSGWKTYWRNPGDAGMAPEFDFSGSTNLKFRSVAYPVPEIGKDVGGRFVGYHHPVSLVLEFDKPDAAAPASLRLGALVGVCAEICLPFAADFKLDLDHDAPEAEEFSALMTAEAELPELPGQDFAVRSFRKTADGTAAVADVVIPAGTPVEAAVAASRGVRLGKDPVVEVTGKAAKITVPVRKIDKAGGPHHITLLVKAGGRAMETTLALD